MKHAKITIIFILSLTMVLTGCQSASKDRLDPDKLLTITIWHHYDDAQLKVFNRLVENFNDTVGIEKGMIVKAIAQGSESDLEKKVLDSINKKADADALPNIFVADANTAYHLNKRDGATDLSEYFSEEELSEYISSYIEEGYFNSNNKLILFPIAKSTEVLMLNQTDWDKFSVATNVSVDELSTFEGISATAQKYYEYTDSLTSQPNDGKAFFGIDEVANLFIVGFKQHGRELFTVDKNGDVTLDFNKKIVKKIWDNYYVPYIKGHFTSTKEDINDDIESGTIISYIGSSTQTSLFPKEVITSDGESYQITNSVHESPIFNGQNKVAVQQGSGMIVTKAEQKEVLAAVEFLKWFTQVDQNIDFSISGGYLPVKKKANDMDRINTHVIADLIEIEDAVSKTIHTVNTSLMYTTKAFENKGSAHKLLEQSLYDKAVADRKAVMKNIAAGTTYGVAISQFTHDDHFNQWYDEIKAKLKGIVK